MVNVFYLLLVVIEISCIYFSIFEKYLNICKLFMINLDFYYNRKIVILSCL